MAISVYFIGFIPRTPTMIAPGKANKPLASRRLHIKAWTDHNIRVKLGGGVGRAGREALPAHFAAARKTRIPHAPEALPALPFRLDLTI
jgi:hypothetical protein